MARKGSFGGGINPFGSSAPSGLSGYSIGSQLASLDAYKVKVGWQNGTVSDDDYLASLQRVLDASAPDTTARVTAQNDLDDAKYTIGRQAAQDKGLDALVSFDQKSLAGMLPTNNHADDVKNSLATEMAQARSRDYGKLVDRVNAGSLGTSALLDWVNSTLSTIPADAPDRDNWGQTQSTLAQRLLDEKDSQAYQDYQNGDLKGPDLLSYITGRRDSYDPQSENYAAWQRKLDDATKNVTDTAFARADTAFFDAYNAGQKSDVDYLAYIKSRLDAMTPDDQQYEEWRYRYTTAAFSVAEDQLTKDVNNNKRPTSDLVTFYTSYAQTLNTGSAEWRNVQNKIDSLKTTIQNQKDAAFYNTYQEGQVSDTAYLAYLKQRLDSTDPSDPDYENIRHSYVTAKQTLAENQLVFDVNEGKKPVSALVAFYKGYEKTLDPGSEEWRQTQSKLDSLAGRTVGGAGGGGSKGIGSAVLGMLAGKVISGQITLDTMLPYIIPNPHAKSNDQKAALAIFKTDYGRLQDAITYGDATWQFVNPANGKEITLPTSQKALANMDVGIANYHTGLADIAKAAGDQKTYFTEIGLADNSNTHARATYNSIALKDNQQQYDAASKLIDYAVAHGQPGVAYNTITSTIALIRQDLADPALSDTRWIALEALAQKLADNPIMPQPMLDAQGNQMTDQFGKPIQVGGAIDKTASTFDANGAITKVVLNPNYHAVLSDGATPGVQYVRSTLGPQEWQQNHMAVSVALGGQLVTGDVAVQAAPAGTTVYGTIGRLPGNFSASDMPRAFEMEWTDQFGHTQKAYSVDGQRWVVSADGQPPTLQLTADMTKVTTTDSKGNAVTVYNGPDGNPAFVRGADGVWVAKKDWFDANPGTYNWIGLDPTAPWTSDTATTALGTPGQRLLVFQSTTYTDDQGGQTVTLNTTATPMLSKQEYEARAAFERGGQLPPPPAATALQPTGREAAAAWLTAQATTKAYSAAYERPQIKALTQTGAPSAASLSTTSALPGVMSTYERPQITAAPTTVMQSTATWGTFPGSPTPYTEKVAPPPIPAYPAIAQAPALKPVPPVVPVMNQTTASNLLPSKTVAPPPVPPAQFYTPPVTVKTVAPVTTTAPIVRMGSTPKAF